MKKKEDFLKMSRDSGTITTGVKSFSYDKELGEIMSYFMIDEKRITGSKLLKVFFMKKLNLKKEKELENFVWELLLKESNVKDNFSEEMRKTMIEYFIERCKKELKETENPNIKKQMKVWIDRGNERLKNEDFKRGKYGEI